VSLALLDAWFKRNTNVIPPVFTLQPISSVLPDYALDSVINYTVLSSTYSGGHQIAETHLVRVAQQCCGSRTILI